MVIDEGPFVFGNDRQGEAWNVKIYVLGPWGRIRHRRALQNAK